MTFPGLHLSIITVFSSICPTFPLRAKQNVLARVSHALSQRIFDVKAPKSDFKSYQSHTMNFNVNLFTYLYTYTDLVDCNLLSHSMRVPPS
jgi:hypothetical protein